MSDSETNWRLEGDLHLWWSLDEKQTLWEERFEKILEIAENPVIALSPEGIVLKLNEAAAVHFGREKNQLVGKHIVKDLHEIDHPVETVEDLESSILKTQSKSRRSKEPSLRYFPHYIQWSSVRIYAQDKTFVGLLCYGTDVTEAQEVEQRLKRTLKELKDEKSALDQAAIVAVTDVEGKITYANEKFCELSQYSEEELIGKTHRVINSGYHTKDFWQYLWRTISSGKVWKGDIRNRAKDGSIYWVDTTIIPFLNEETKKPYRYVSIRFNVTDKKAAQKKIDEERLRSVFAGRLASLGEMAAGVAHEIGTPLGIIRGRMELLQFSLDKGEIDRSKLESTLNIVTDQVDKMAKIIRGILSSARDGSGDPFQMKSVSEMVSNVLEYSTERFRKYGIEIKPLEIDPKLEVYCRETQVIQVISNLISNACDAVKDFKDPWIKFEAEAVEDEVEVRIIDCGLGIGDELLNKITDPFFTTKGVGKGTGLGLSISKKMIEENGGRLWTETKHPNTCFSFRLPSKKTEKVL